MRPVPSLLASRSGPRTRWLWAKLAVVDHSSHMRASRLARAQTMALWASTSPLCTPEGKRARALSRVMAAGAVWACSTWGSSPVLPSRAPEVNPQPMNRRRSIVCVLVGPGE